MNPHTKQTICSVFRTLNFLSLLCGLYLLHANHDVPWIACLTLLGNILPLWLFGGLRCVRDCGISNEAGEISHGGIQIREKDSSGEDIE